VNKYLIVGGVAGGATIAARLRRLDEHAQIIMFDRGEHISYANCGLPYYIGEVIEDREKLFLQTPESFGRLFNMQVRAESDVIAVNRADKTITVKNIKTQEIYQESYDKLILSPGAKPIIPPIKGIDNDKIFTLRNVPDTDKIKHHIDQNQLKRAVVIGAGFIGLEMAENLHHRGLQVTIVEMNDQMMSPIDYEMAAEVHQHLKIKGIESYLQDGVAHFKEAKDKVKVVLQSKKEIEADIVILSIGVQPDDFLAKEANLKIVENGGIWVDEYLRTSDENIYAIGDAIAFNNPIINKSMTAYLAGPANRQARLCADNIVDGNHRQYSGSILTAIAKIFDITVASTGIAEKVLKRENISYVASITHSASHAGYYPGAIPLSIKITFNKRTGKLFGAQIVGYKGIDKRIDIIATVIKMGGTIYDLQDIEHAYAPPYSSAKDPVAIAAYTAENIIHNKVNIIAWDKLDANNPAVQIIDVRTEDEYALGCIDNAINLPLEVFRERLDEVDKTKDLVIYCSVGQRAYVACRILMQTGCGSVHNLVGGFKTYGYATQIQDNNDLFVNDYIDSNNVIYQTKTDPHKSKEVIEATLDVCGVACPGPIIKMKKRVNKLKQGEVLKIIASDAGFYNDVSAWCNLTKNELISLEMLEGNIVAMVKKL
jgi:NADPH-dependent 2,4-dienoyl-CoA reductase/sulfur reductase-like enzyme/TusA-related sulfurtransferase/rhodanese-related sulfurtransferase